MRYSLTSTEIAGARGDAKRWHAFIRRREFELISLYFRGRRWINALELGAGDGEQSMTISRHCEFLTCTELESHGKTASGPFAERNLPNVRYLFCDAQDLSRFASGSFDLVFGSNMLEHVPDPIACLRECARVVQSDGYVVHTMPSVSWKIWNYLLFPIARRRWPEIHGTANTHLSELIRFSRPSWTRIFRSSGLTLRSVVGLPFYMGHGPRFMPLISFGNAVRWAGTFGYIAQTNR